MGISSKALLLHSSMYALSLLTEIKHIREQYHSNRYPVFYFSTAATSFQLFAEFIFQLLNEKCEPLVLLLESIKALLRFKEYNTLINKEGIKLYIESQEYNDHKKVGEVKQTHYKLSQTGKLLPKIKNFTLPDRIKQIRERSNFRNSGFDDLSSQGEFSPNQRGDPI